MNPLSPRFWIYWCAALVVLTGAFSLNFLLERNWPAAVIQFTCLAANVALIAFWKKQ